MLDLVEVAGFEQGWVHHPPDLPRQPHHQLEAAGREAEAGQDEDGAEDDQETQQLVLKPTHKMIKSILLRISKYLFYSWKLYTLL